MKRKPLSEQEQLQIIELVARNGKQWVKISNEMKTRSPSTIKSFYQLYETRKSLSSQAGLPKTIDSEIENAVVGYMNADPKQTLQEVVDSFDLSRTLIKTILNKNKITYHKKISTPPLLQHHKNCIEYNGQ